VIAPYAQARRGAGKGGHAGGEHGGKHQRWVGLYELAPGIRRGFEVIAGDGRLELGGVSSRRRSRGGCAP
jgi:hypothetical protein